VVPGVEFQGLDALVLHMAELGSKHVALSLSRVDLVSQLLVSRLGFDSLLEAMETLLHVLFGVFALLKQDLAKCFDGMGLEVSCHFVRRTIPSHLLEGLEFWSL